MQVKHALRTANTTLRALPPNSTAMRSAVNKKLVTEHPGSLALMTVVSLTKFIEAGEMPRSTDGKSVDASDLPLESKVVFFSHRWFRPQDKHPDDARNSKWAVIVAVGRALAAKHDINETSLYLWIDFSSGGGPFLICVHCTHPARCSQSTKKIPRGGSIRCLCTSNARISSFRSHFKTSTGIARGASSSACSRSKEWKSGR